MLLLPHGLTDRLTPAQLDAVLAHQMCHARRRDNLTAALHMPVEALFWFYPLVWWIRTRLVREREQACDEAVLQLGSDAEVYAEGILNVCKFYAESPVVCVSGISGSDLSKRFARVLTERAAINLEFSRKLLLGVAGLLPLAMPIMFGLVNATPSRAESQAEKTAAVGPVFEVASIKPNKSGVGGSRIMFNRDRFTSTNITLHMLVRVAYGVEDFQISGAPNWEYESYDVEAKVDSATADELQKLSQDQRKLQNQRMLLALLADRFKLMLHRETKELPVYALVIAKSGPKLQKSKAGDDYANGVKGPDGIPFGPHFMRFGPGELTSQGGSMANVVPVLSQRVGRPVLDKTGLTGEYDFTLKWTPGDGQSPLGGQPGADSASPPESSGPSIFTALQEQLGLKLESTKGPVEILVIDHVARPSEN